MSGIWFQSRMVIPVYQHCWKRSLPIHLYGIKNISSKQNTFFNGALLLNKKNPTKNPFWNTKKATGKNLVEIKIRYDSCAISKS
jgi:hypothetical protein